MSKDLLITKRIITVIFLNCLLILGAFGTTLQSRYSDVLVSGPYIIGLNLSGGLDLYDTASGNRLDKKLIDSSEIVTNICKDHFGRLVTKDSKGGIKAYDHGAKKWITLFENHVGNIYYLVFDSHNKCYAIVDSGIVDLANDKTYFPDTSLSQNHQLRYFGRWRQPKTVVIDSYDNIWVGFGHGEWGGDLFCLEIKKGEFHKFDWDRTKNTIRYFQTVQFAFCDEHSLYLTSGLSHLSRTDGSIVEYFNFIERPVFSSYTVYDTVKKNGLREVKKQGEYIGPGMYNPYNKCIYFYSQHGIFKGDRSKDLSKLENWILVTDLHLTWGEGQADATGPAMNLLKMEAIGPEKIVFLAKGGQLSCLSNGTLRALE